MKPSRVMPQRGAATLAIVTALLLVMMLTTAALQRGLVFELKASTHQYRATQAQEAAEAGLEWAMAQLNGGRIDEQCRPADDGRVFRDRVLVQADRRSGQFEATFDPARSAAPACVHTGEGWRCSCPAQGRSTPRAVSGADLHPGFRVELSGVATGSDRFTGAMRIVAHGCAHTGDTFCADADGSAGEPGHAVASVQAALLPALAAVPPAPLVAAGDVDLGTDAPGVHNPDSRSGLLVHSGGALRVESARLSPPPGTPADTALIERDRALAARPAEQWLQLYLGLARGAFEQLPGVATVPCEAGCEPALRRAFAEGFRMLRVAGNATLRDLMLGTPDDPVLLVIEGNARLSAGVRITGALLCRSLQWQHGESGTDLLRGAAIVWGNVAVSGSPDFVYDAEVLRLLQRQVGTFVRIPGTWKDAL